jgi:hypothetical protein
MVKGLLFALLVFLGCAPAASAAVAYVGGGQIERPSRSYTFVSYRAEPGETNLVIIVRERGGQRIRDEGAPIDARSGCDPISSHEVFCHSNEGLGVDLGDGNDSLVAPAGQFDGGDGNDTIHAHGGIRGGPGDDVLTGRAGPDALDGGGGHDVLHGAGGNDRLTDGDNATTGVGPDTLEGGPGSDTVSYSERAGPLVFDLRRPGGQGGPDGDNVKSIENVEAASGTHPTRAIGDGHSNDFNVFADRSVLRGMGGNDFLTAWSNYRDTLSGGPGNDLLAPSGDEGSEPDALSCGSGRDSVYMSEAPAQYVPPDCEWVIDNVDADLRYRLLGPLPSLDAPVARVRYGCNVDRADDCRAVWAVREELGTGSRSFGPLLVRRPQRVRLGERGAPTSLRLTRRGRALLERRRSIRARLGFLERGRVVGGFAIRVALAEP